MAKINVLDSSVFNLISAGEVVERPSSVVKELVENSIDAGANSVSVEIKDGGISSIVVTDNGSGIDKENMRLAFLPHATSKLAKAEDLDSIATLGFRGEALASIAAVSQVTMTSKTSEDSVGNYIVLEAGKIVEEGQRGLAQSTSIAVENLFFNTPVRKKFLKKPKMEEASVTSVMTQLALANPDIKFKYTVDGNVVFQTNGGLEEAVYSVYKNEIANELLPFSYTYDKYKLYGYTGTAAVAKHNRNYQTIIVNGRVISNSTISTAVSQAYGNRLMTRTFPVFILNIIMPFDEVDVNVHPTKTDVRFADSRKLFSCIYKAISTVLAEQEQALILGKTLPKVADDTENTVDKKSVCAKSIGENAIGEKFDSEKFDSENSLKYDENVSKTKLDYAAAIESKSDNYFESVEHYDDVKTNEIIDRQKKKLEEMKYHRELQAANRVVSDSATVSAAKRSSFYEDERQQAEQSSLLELAESRLNQDYAVIGQIFSTYLILESEGKVYFIDQHACHERFIYDELLKQVNEGSINIQDMLIPYILECSSYQYEFISSMQENLKRLGFDIEEFGGMSFKISSVPLVLSYINLGMFFENLMADKQSVQSLKSSDLIRDRLAQKACKSAIKAGAKLNEAQIRQLLDSMKDGIPLQCPHGRPAVIAYSRKDFDKLFKRIV